MAQAGGRPAVGMTATIRCETSLRPREQRPLAPVVAGEAGRRALWFVRRLPVGYDVGRPPSTAAPMCALAG